MEVIVEGTAGEIQWHSGYFLRRDSIALAVNLIWSMGEEEKSRMILAFGLR